MILGSYRCAQGGRIYLNLSGNLENRSMFGTVQHEAGHALLTETTLLGTLQKVMFMESMASEKYDTTYSVDRECCARILSSKTEIIQEIYANNLELLTLEKEFGSDEMMRALRNRPQEYQNYFFEMMPVHHSKLSNQKKLEYIHSLCTYSMNLPIPQQALKDYISLSGFLRGQNDPYFRLKQAIACFEEKGIVPEQTLDGVAVLQFIEEITFYIKPYIRAATANLDNLLEKASPQSLNELFNKQIMKRICLFDLSAIHPKRNHRQTSIDNDVFIAIKGIQSLPSDKHYYLIGYDQTYIGREVNSAELDGCVEQCISGCILMSEYRQFSEMDKVFENKNKLLTVIIQTSEECTQWVVEEKKKGALYVGELRAVCNQTDISILFFSRRGYPRRVFVFPTLRAIRNRLLRDFDMDNNCYQADEEAFLSILSYLKDELVMSKYIGCELRFQNRIQLIILRIVYLCDFGPFSKHCHE